MRSSPAASNAEDLIQVASVCLLDEIADDRHPQTDIELGESHRW